MEFKLHGFRKFFYPKFSRYIRASKYLSIKLPLLCPGMGLPPTEAPLLPKNTRVDL